MNPEKKNEDAAGEVYHAEAKPESTTEEDAQAAASELAEGLRNSIAELIDNADSAREFKAPSGRSYRLVGVKDWSLRQNFASREIYKSVEKAIRGAAPEQGGEKEVSMMTILDALITTELWCDLFSILYVPVDTGVYDDKKVKEYVDDFMDLTNEQAMEALVFFIASSVSSIPRGILDFFRPKMKPLAPILDVLDKRKEQLTGSSSSPRG